MASSSDETGPGGREDELRRALAASERAYRARFENVDLPQASYDLQGRCIAANDAFCRLLGVERRDLLGRTTLHLHHALDAQFGIARAEAVLTGRAESDSWERVFQRPDGTPVPVYVNAALVRDEQGRPDRMAVFLQDLTKLWEAEEQLSTIVARHNAVMAHASDWLLIVDAEGTLQYVSASVDNALGYDAEAVTGLSGWDFAHPDDAPAVRAALERVAAEPGRREVCQLRIRAADGRWVWYEEVLTNRLDDPVLRGIVCNGRDVTERVEAEHALRASESWFRSIATTAHEGIWVVGERGETLFGNETLAQILGVPLAEVAQRSAAELLGPSGEAHLTAHAASAEAHGLNAHELVYLHPDGAERRLQVRTSALDRDGSPALLCMVSDLTEMRQIEAQLQRSALYDDLTGLPNRALLRDRLDRALSRTGTDRGAGPVAVLLADLDHFKLVNDTWGHAVGDDLLVAVAGRIAAEVRPQDTVARFGGDEFVIVCEGLDEGEVQALAERIIGAVSERVDVNGHTTYVGVSIGIAMAPPEPPADLLRFADSAMYDAKARGRGRVRLFDVELAEAASDRLVLGGDLREALAAGGLELHYQPVVELSTGAVTAVEALARWDHPAHGPIPPTRFVGVAEATGQSPALDRWALQQAAADAVRLRELLHRDLRVSVNISAAHLGDGRLEAVLASVPAAESLLLELTENSLMANPAAARDALDRLRVHGVQIAIDDFGTGYSSLAYLSQLPVQVLKIDRAFVLNLVADRDAFAITAAIVDLARTLGLRTVAEGVETPEQLALLRQLGCWAGQGFLWSPALPLDDLVTTVRRLPGGRFPVAAEAAAQAPAGRRPREQLTAEHGLTELRRLHGEGASLATIAAALNADGYRTPQGVRWHRASVARVISDMAYPQLRG